MVMDSQIVVRIETEDRDRIERIADERQWTFSQAARTLIREALDIRAGRVSTAVVYIMSDFHGMYKIGCTSDLNRRYDSKATRKKIVAIVPVPYGMNMYEAERQIHRLFANKRKGQAEAFDLTPEDIERCKSYQWDQPKQQSQ